MSFTVLGSEFSVRVQVRFGVRRSGFGVRAVALLLGPVRTPNPEPANREPNLNTNREVRTRKRERQDHP